MVARKNDSVPAPSPDRTAIILEAKEGVITAGNLAKALAKLPADTVMTLCVGPSYTDTPLEDVVYWPQHGAAFLLGNVEDRDEDEDDVIVGEWVPVPQDEEEEEEPHDPEAAEPA